jgi:hypothetical protein
MNKNARERGKLVSQFSKKSNAWPLRSLEKNTRGEQRKAWVNYQWGQLRGSYFLTSP